MTHIEIEPKNFESKISESSSTILDPKFLPSDNYDIYKGWEIRDQNLIRKIEKNIVQYSKLSAKYKKNEKFYTKWFYGLGFTQVVFTVIVTTLGGAGGITNSDDILSSIIFWIGLTTAIFSSITVFFKLEERSGKHHTAKGQYGDMVFDLEANLDFDHNERDLQEYINIYNEKEKFINSYEPNCSGSCCVRYFGEPIKESVDLCTPVDKKTFLENELRKELCNYKYLRDTHDINEAMHSHLFILFYAPQTILSLTMTVFTGLGGFTNLSGNQYVITAFVFSVIATVISSIRSVWRFQKTASLHHNASGQHSDLSKDLKTKLRLGFDDRDDIQDTLNDAKEKIKFINAYAPSFNICV